MTINRRSFFRRLGVLSVLSLTAPFLSFKRQQTQPTPPISRWKFDAPHRTIVPNPEWHSAPYEVAFIIEGNKWNPLSLRFSDKESAQFYMDRVTHIS